MTKLLLGLTILVLVYIVGWHQIYGQFINCFITDNMEITSNIILTDCAASHISEMLVDDTTNTGKSLRVYVEGGGCSGLQYGMVFDETRDDDVVSEYFGVKVLTDKFSANYLSGCVIDYSDELIGGGFKINNPNAESSCGCGKSFAT